MMRSWLAAAFTALLLVACLPSLPALASEEGPIEHAIEREEQTGAFKGSLDMTIWSIAVFLLLLAVLWKYAWGPIMQGLDKREKTIALALEEAKKAQDEARHLRADLQEQRERAAKAAAAVVDEARRNAQQMVEEMKAQALAGIQADRERLNREMDRKHDQALADLVQHASQLATLVAAKAISRQLTGDDHRRLVDEALAEMGSAAKERQRVLTGLA